MKDYEENSTEVLEAYLQFACKRQEIFFSRMSKDEAPWTEDPILQEYKFTNAYRITDRVSQYLVRNVIYTDNEFSDEDVLFRIILFKLFNKIETWEELEKKIGVVSYSTYRRIKYEEIFNELLAEKRKIYSAAYIMPSGCSSFGFERKYKNNLSLLESMMHDGLPSKIAKVKSLKNLYELLLSYPTIGPFLAFQYAIDINYSELCDFSEMSFVVAGPGARRGIEKCFNLVNYDYEDIIRFVSDNQIELMEKRGLKFKTLYGRPLQLIDCQNLFCETDKYARVAFPEINSNAHTRIKQKFVSNHLKIKYFFPPKWNLKIRQGEGDEEWLK